MPLSLKIVRPGSAKRSADPPPTTPSSVASSGSAPGTPSVTSSSPSSLPKPRIKLRTGTLAVQLAKQRQEQAQARAGAVAAAQLDESESAEEESGGEDEEREEEEPDGLGTQAEQSIYGRPEAGGRGHPGHGDDEGDEEVEEGDDDDEDEDEEEDDDDEEQDGDEDEEDGQEEDADERDDDVRMDDRDEGQVEAQKNGYAFFGPSSVAYAGAEAGVAGPVPAAPPVPRQRRPKMLRKKPLREALQRVLTQLKRRDTYGFFLKPVQPEEAPGYFDVIKEPMDFGTMQDKVDTGSYRHPDEFRDDLLLVTQNSQRYNPEGTLYHNEAKKLERWGLAAIEREGRAAILPKAGEVQAAAPSPSPAVRDAGTGPETPGAAGLSSSEPTREGSAGGRGTVKVNLRAMMSGPIKGVEAARKEAERGVYMPAAMAFGVVALPRGFEDESGVDLPALRRASSLAGPSKAVGTPSAATPGAEAAHASTADSLPRKSAPPEEHEGTRTLSVKREEDGETMDEDAAAAANVANAAPKSPEVGRERSNTHRESPAPSLGKRPRESVGPGEQEKKRQHLESAVRFLAPEVPVTSATRVADLSPKYLPDGSIDLASIDAVARRQLVLPQALGIVVPPPQPEVVSVLPLHPTIYANGEALLRPTDLTLSALGAVLATEPPPPESTGSHVVETLPPEQRLYPMTVPSGLGLGRGPTLGSASTPEVPPAWPRHTGAPVLPESVASKLTKGRQREAQREAASAARELSDWSYSRDYYSRRLQTTDLGLYPGLLPAKWRAHIRTGASGADAERTRLPPYHLSVTDAFDKAIRDELSHLAGRSLYEAHPPTPTTPAAPPAARPRDFAAAVAESAARGWRPTADAVRMMGEQGGRTILHDVWGNHVGEAYARSVADFVGGAVRIAEARGAEREREERWAERLERLEAEARRKRRDEAVQRDRDEAERRAAKLAAQEEWRHELHFLVPPASPRPPSDEAATSSTPWPGSAPARGDSVGAGLGADAARESPDSKPRLGARFGGDADVDANLVPPKAPTPTDAGGEQMYGGLPLGSSLADWVRDEVLSPLTSGALDVLTEASQLVRVSRSDAHRRRGGARCASAWARREGSALQRVIACFLSGRLARSLLQLGELSQAASAPVELEGVATSQADFYDEPQQPDDASEGVEVRMRGRHAEGRSDRFARAEDDGDDENEDDVDGGALEDDDLAGISVAPLDETADEAISRAVPLRWRNEEVDVERAHRALSQYARILTRLSQQLWKMRGAGAGAGAGDEGQSAQVEPRDGSKAGGTADEAKPPPSPSTATTTTKGPSAATNGLTQTDAAQLEAVRKALVALARMLPVSEIANVAGATTTTTTATTTTAAAGGAVAPKSATPSAPASTKPTE